MTNWVLYGQKGNYDWNHNEEYKKCPYCGSDNHLGSFRMGQWEKKYRCGLVVKANWSNDGYTITYKKGCEVKEGVYAGKEVVGRVLV